MGGEKFLLTLLSDAGEESLPGVAILQGREIGIGNRSHSTPVYGMQCGVNCRRQRAPDRIAGAMLLGAW